MELKTKYLPISTKKQIVDQIVVNCLTEDENSMMVFDYFNYQLALDLSLVEFYLDDNIEDMDKFYEEEKMTELYKLIPESEVEFIINAVESAIQEKKEVNNSVSAVLAKTLNKLIDKLPSDKDLSKLIKEIPKQINKINPSNLEAITSALGGKKLGE